MLHWTQYEAALRGCDHCKRFFIKMVNFCWVFPFFHTTAAFYHLQAGHTGCLCSAWWLIINKYDNVIFQYPHWGEREGGGRERKECWKSSGFWDTLQIQTLKLQWNAGVMSIWLSTGHFQVCFCREPQACCCKIWWDFESLDNATWQPRLTRALEVCLMHDELMFQNSDKICSVRICRLFPSSQQI